MSGWDVGAKRRISGWRAWVIDRWRPQHSQQALLLRLETIEQRLDALDRTLRELRGGTNPAEGLEALREGLAALEKQIGRAGREQFKANTLAEAQAARLEAMLEAQRAADTRREADLAALREQNRSAQANARLEVIRSLLPILDGLDEALRSGQRLLTTTGEPLHGSAPAATPAQRQGSSATAPSFVDWLFGRSPAQQQASDHAQQQLKTLREALEAWLVGLTFVRQRLLDTLAAEGVRPMNAEGQPFDPQLHVALEVVPANGLPPGTVAAELRRGYVAGNRVLRHAEVAVAADHPPAIDQSGDTRQET